MTPGSVVKFVQELKRRRVFRGFVVNGASTLIIFEAADNFCTAIGVDGVPKWFLLLLGIGFLGSMWFSWIYDFTPDGLVKTEPSKDYPVPLPGKKLRTYKLITFLSVAVIIGMVSFWVIDGFAAKKMKSLEKSIAVLPLAEDYRGPEISDDYEEFVGITITSCLTGIDNYSVIPWEDTRKYPRSNKKYSKIGSDLSAAILVDWRPLELKLDKFLSVSLIAAEQGNSLWSDEYKIDKDWSSAEISKCSRKISRKITKKLRIILTREERAFLNTLPTSPKATMLASLGNTMLNDTRASFYTGTTDFDTLTSEYIDSLRFKDAIEYFTNAIAEDSTLAIAYAQRAKARLWAIRVGFLERNLLDECESDITAALFLEPELPEALVAMGFYHYYGNDEYKLAAVYFEKAVELSPNNPEYLFYLSLIWRRLGEWDKVLPLIQRVFAANPRNALFQTNMGVSYQYLHDFSKSVECQDRAIDLVPGWVPAHINKRNAQLWMGGIDQARRTIQNAIILTGENLYEIQAENSLYEGRFDEAVSIIEKAAKNGYRESEMSEGDYLLLKARIYRHAQDETSSIKYFKFASDHYKNTITFDPDDYRAISRLGMAYAGSGLIQEGLDLGNQAMELIANVNDGITVPEIHYNMIRILSYAGQDSIAKKMIEEHLNIPSPYTIDFFRIDPDLSHLFKDSGS